MILINNEANKARLKCAKIKVNKKNRVMNKNGKKKTVVEILVDIKLIFASGFTNKTNRQRGIRDARNR